MPKQPIPMNQLRILSSFLITLTISCSGNELKDLEDITLQDKIGIERVTGVELLYSDSAIVRVEIHAPTLLRYIDKESPKQVFPEGLEADFYNTHHIQTSRLVAKYAEQFQKEHKVYLKDSVKIWNNKNELLETDELTWDETSKQISSKQFVKITTPSQIITGFGFISNLDFTSWEIYEVKGMVESNNIVNSPF